VKIIYKVTLKTWKEAKLEAKDEENLRQCTAALKTMRPKKYNYM